MDLCTARYRDRSRQHKKGCVLHKSNHHDPLNVLRYAAPSAVAHVQGRATDGRVAAAVGPHVAMVEDIVPDRWRGVCDAIRLRKDVQLRSIRRNRGHNAINAAKVVAGCWVFPPWSPASGVPGRRFDIEASVAGARPATTDRMVWLCRKPIAVAHVSSL